MNIKDIEWQLGRIKSSQIFGPVEQQTLVETCYITAVARQVTDSAQETPQELVDRLYQMWNDQHQLNTARKHVLSLGALANLSNDECYEALSFLVDLLEAKNETN